MIETMPVILSNYLQQKIPPQLTDPATKDKKARDANCAAFAE